MQVTEVLPQILYSHWILRAVKTMFRYHYLVVCLGCFICVNSERPDQTDKPVVSGLCGFRASHTLEDHFLTLILLNPDVPYLCKQCRSRSVGF